MERLAFRRPPRLLELVVCVAATGGSAFLLGVLVDPGIRGIGIGGVVILLVMLSLIAIGIGLAAEKRWAAIGGMALAPVLVAVGVFLVVVSARSVLLWSWWLPTMGLVALSMWELVARRRVGASTADVETGALADS
jgi:hypothetical protein